MLKGLIWFVIISIISIFIGIASDNYMGGIITFIVLGSLAIVISVSLKVHRDKS